MRLSYSSINTYETCPAKFKFQYEDCVPQGPSPALSFGTPCTRRSTCSTTGPSRWRLPRGCTNARGHVGLRRVLRRVEERMYRDHGRQVLAQYHRRTRSVPDPGRARVRFQIEVEGVTLSGSSTGWTGSPAAATDRRLQDQRRLPLSLVSTRTCSCRSTTWRLARSGASSPSASPSTTCCRASA
jgi:hypothetical protein